jgi:hypothetical protein
MFYIFSLNDVLRKNLLRSSTQTYNKFINNASRPYTLLWYVDTLSLKQLSFKNNNYHLLFHKLIMSELIEILNTNL